MSSRRFLVLICGSRIRIGLRRANQHRWSNSNGAHRLSGMYEVQLFRGRGVSALRSSNRRLECIEKVRVGSPQPDLTTTPDPIWIGEVQPSMSVPWTSSPSSGWDRELAHFPKLNSYLSWIAKLTLAGVRILKFLSTFNK